MIGKAVIHIGFLLAVAGVCSASTATYIVDTGSGSSAKDAKAIFSLSAAGVLTLTLQDLVQNPTSAGQNVSGIKLTLTGLTGDTMTSATADLIDVTSKNQAPQDLGVGALTHWTASTSASQLTVTTIGGGTPTQTIIGSPNGSGFFSNANSSITGNHNPFANGTATFIITLTGLGGNANLDSILSAVQIGFGTGGTDYYNATKVVVTTPEPGTVWLSGLSMAAIALLVRRKRALTVSARQA